jgi:casein kinase II subunit alpha
MKGVSTARLYSEVNSNQAQEATDYSSLVITWGKQENYEILRKLGRGKYSDVYEGLDMVSKAKVVIKILKPIKKSKVLREIKVHRVLEACSGVPRLLDIVKDSTTKIPALIMERCQSQDLVGLFSKVSEEDFKFYMFEVLKIIDSAHAKGVMHRDIKPSNILIDHSQRSVKIIDWGLAEFYFPDRPFNVKVASRYYKAPELLVNYQYYDYSVDMWAFGVMFAGFIFKKHPFFHGHDNYDQLVKIVRTLGTVNFYEYLQKFDINLDERFEDLKMHYNPKSWLKLVTSETVLATPDAIDLLSKMLVFDHSDRILPSEAMQHPYFSSIKDLWRKVDQNLAADSSETLSILIAKKRSN